MAIPSAGKHSGTWRESRWLVFLEFLLVVAIYVARQHHILKVSATPYLFILGWISLRVRARAYG